MKKGWFFVVIMTVLCIACALTACGEKAQSHVVTFDANYAGGGSTSAVVADGQTVALSPVARTGYVFDGWYEDAACTQAVDPDAKIKSDVTYYAKWVQDATVPSADSSQGTPSGTDISSGTDTPAGGTPSGTDTPTDGGEPEARTLMGIAANYAGTVKRGAPLDRNAITVTAIYTVGEPRVVSDYTLACDYAATNGTHAVDVTYQEDGVSCDCTMTYTLDTEQITPRATTALYFTNNKGWSTVYAYLWRNVGGNTEKNHDWPGVECTMAETNSFGQAVYTYPVDPDAGYQYVIFNNGSEQTHDVALQAGVDGYYLTDKRDGKYDVGTYVRGVNVSVHVLENVGEWAVGGSKKVYVFTPVDYNATKRYKVLYMLDGQNLFDCYDVPGRMGSWGVDVTLTAAGADVIVVGIDNGEGEAVRNNQLTMHQRFGEMSPLLDLLDADKKETYLNGTLDDLGDFIKNTLMPFINDNYSVLTGRENTLIAGSSSGGLAAFYLGMRDADLYGTVGAFSPATGIFTPTAWQQYLSSTAQSAMRKIPQSAFIYCGCDSTDEMENTLYAYDNSAGAGMLEGLLQSVGYSRYGEVRVSFAAGKLHNEAAWREAFATFVAFAFGR